ncbi:uncharacterized protein LOC125121195 [Phacochoerus africanus]|uniref:uncharacterized protein LOC125121195 n=1 Tax=Phacochoerus africanus TaxID=41426 RepID=UPI001FD97AE0|nr:uncharacterized protein LOC125121195 [Phacochoerus africanus]
MGAGCLCPGRSWVAAGRRCVSTRPAPGAAKGSTPGAGRAAPLPWLRPCSLGGRTGSCAVGGSGRLIPSRASHACGLEPSPAGAGRREPVERRECAVEEGGQAAAEGGVSFGARVPVGAVPVGSPVETLVLELGRHGCARVWPAKERVPWGPAGLPVLAAGLWRVPRVGPERPTGGRLREPGSRPSGRVALCAVDTQQAWGAVWGRQASGVPRVPWGDRPEGARSRAPGGLVWRAWRVKGERAEPRAWRQWTRLAIGREGEVRPCGVLHRLQGPWGPGGSSRRVSVWPGS